GCKVMKTKILQKLRVSLVIATAVWMVGGVDTSLAQAQFQGYVDCFARVSQQDRFYVDFIRRYPSVVEVSQLCRKGPRFVEEVVRQLRTAHETRLPPTGPVLPGSFSSQVRGQYEVAVSKDWIQSVLAARLANAL